MFFVLCSIFLCSLYNLQEHIEKQKLVSEAFHLYCHWARKRLCPGQVYTIYLVMAMPKMLMGPEEAEK